MTPRERWMALFNNETPDRIPTDYSGTPEVTQRLLKDLKCADRDELYKKLHIDGTDPIDAPLTVSHHPSDSEADIWGIRFKTVDYGSGVYSEASTHPLGDVTTVEQVHAYKWPSADDCDYEAFKEQVLNVSGKRIVLCGCYEPYLLYCYLRGMEQAMMDLLTEPDIADAILTHLFEYHYQCNERMFDIGHGVIDMTKIAEDLGSQTSLLMGMDQIRRFILPNQKKMADLARSHDIHIFYHSDGAVFEVIPDLIEVTGIEILNPIQWRCTGMEREALVRDFGDKIIFHGSIDNQETLPFGTPDDVRREVLESIEIYSSGRWICAPCHNLQPVSTTENVVTLYETIWQNGKL